MCLIAAIETMATPRKRSTGRGQKRKRLEIEIFKQRTPIGTFDSSLHTDIRTCVLKYVRAFRKRGRTVHLSASRMNAVDDALKRDGADGCRSLEQLREVVRKCQSSFSTSASFIEKYYDADRADGYTRHNAHPQKVLTSRVLELAGCGTMRNVKQTKIALDMGCGTGLSTHVVQDHGFAVIGVDLSSHMLGKAAATSFAADTAPATDFVRADLSQPLPFRRSIFDAAFVRSSRRRPTPILVSVTI